MKVRWITLLAVALAILAVTVLLAGTPNTASADGGPHRGGTGGTSMTNGCASCHRAHTASGAGLLKASSAYALCYTCHGPGGGDPDPYDSYNTDTKTGNTLGAPLKGGGFLYANMNISATITGTVPNPIGIITGTTTSAHRVFGDPNYGSVTNVIWGSGAINAAPYAGEAGFQLQCSTCHDPHGGSGGFDTSTTPPKRIATYRILRGDFTYMGMTDVTGGSVVSDTIANHVYNITDTTNKWYYGQDYLYPSEITGTTGILMPQLNDWCGKCHARIHTGTGSTGTGSTASGDAIFQYRHVTGGSNVEVNYNTTNTWPTNGAPGCMTCHVSHGSVVSLTSRAASVPWPGGTEGVAPYQDSALLRISNRGVCEACHNK
ncbi:MAG: cytochrome c3 family protein [Anaerolineae bacterium]